MATYAAADAVQTDHPARLRRAGALLVSTVVVAVLFIVSGALTMPAEVELAGQLTPDQMADIRVGWVVMSLLWSVPLVLAAIASAVLGVSRLARILMTLGAAGIVVYFGLMVSLVSFSEDRLGLVGRHDMATLVSIGSYWAGYLATVILGLALFRTCATRWCSPSSLSGSTTSFACSSPDAPTMRSPQLHLTPKTVRNYVSAILAKLHVADRAQAAAKAREAGYPPGPSGHLPD